MSTIQLKSHNRVRTECQSHVTQPLWHQPLDTTTIYDLLRQLPAIDYRVVANQETQENTGCVQQTISVQEIVVGEQVQGKRYVMCPEPSECLH